MFHLKNNIQLLARSKSTFIRVMYLQRSVTRPFTSSVVNKKNYGSNNQRRTSTCQDKDDMSGDSQDPFVAKTPTPTTVYNLSFMPVVNIPQTEFAHSTFFSLHRPLLGLADDKETNFFSSQSIEDENVDVQIANYMANLRPFETPTPPGTTAGQDKGYTTVNYNDAINSIEIEENYYLEQLPMYHMPESDELVEYFSTLQQKLLRQSAFDDITTTYTLGTTKRRQLSAPSIKQLGPSSSRSQKRARQGLYRHRWNK